MNQYGPHQVALQGMLITPATPMPVQTMKNLDTCP